MPKGEDMSRPKCCRRVTCHPERGRFVPEGVRQPDLMTVMLTLDEYEAIRLADYEDLYHEQAAASMGVSRQTFGRIIESARKKVADALVNGRALGIAGGESAVEPGAECPRRGKPGSEPCPRRNTPLCPRFETAE